jgi:hypothetical protein
MRTGLASALDEFMPLGTEIDFMSVDCEGVTRTFSVATTGSASA